MERWNSKIQRIKIKMQTHKKIALILKNLVTQRQILNLPVF